MKLTELFQDKVITYSNFLTMVRILTVPVIAFFFHLENSTGDSIYVHYVFGCYIIIGLSDFFDGYLARRLNQESKLGQYLDPIADKISVISIGALLCYYKGFPAWLFLVVILRDVWMFIAASFLYFLRNVDVKPNIFGKIGIVCIAFTMLTYTFSLSYSFLGITIKQFWIFLVLFFYVLGILESFRIYFKYVKKQ
ncbi:MAG: CDP-alcohol phosphatidyltransferase family protein [bacterium]|nr:CDP-alcohol phosphatidyltransferase family protein [bacterium]